MVARGHAEQRGHDPPDRAGRAVHVGHELVPAGDPHRRAVDPHRAHVGAQLAEREPVAGGGVGQRADDRLARLRARRELRLPRVQRGAAVLGRRPGGAGRRRSGRRCGRSRRARAWRVAARPGAGAWRSSTWGRGGVASAATSRTPRAAPGPWNALCPRVTAMDALLRDRAVLYVTGKGGVGKTTVAAALGLAAAGPAGGRSSARSPSRTGCRARSPATACGRSRRSSSPKDLWAITIDPQQALRGVAGQAARGRRGRARCSATRTRSSTSSPPRLARRS